MVKVTEAMGLDTKTGGGSALGKSAWTHQRSSAEPQNLSIRNLLHCATVYAYEVGL